MELRFNRAEAGARTKDAARAATNAVRTPVLAAATKVPASASQVR